MAIALPALVPAWPWHWRSSHLFGRVTFLLLLLCAVPKACARDAEKWLGAEERAAKAIFPSIKLDDEYLADVVEYFRIKSRDYYVWDPGDKGVNFLVIDQAAAAEVRLSLNLTNVSLKNALLKVKALTGWTIRYDPNVVVFTIASPPAAAPTKPDAKSPLMQRAARIIRPQAQFSGASVEEAVEFLRIPNGCYDGPDLPPKRINYITRLSPRAAKATITLDLRNVTMLEILSYIAEIAGLRLREGRNALILEDADRPDDPALREIPKAVSESTLWKRADAIMLPQVEFAEASVQEAVEFLNLKSKELDPERKSVKITARIPADLFLPTMTLDLREVPLTEVLGYVAEFSGLKLRVAKDVLVLEPR